MGFVFRRTRCKPPGVISFDLTMADHPMPDNGHMAVMGAAAFA
jgi:hypothetical protein